MPNVSALLDTMPLRADVHVAHRPDGLVFLDVGGDAYLSLYAPAANDGDGVDDVDIDGATFETLLGDAGLLTNRQATPRLRHAGRPWRELSTPSPNRPSLATVCAFALAFVRASWCFRTRSFAGLLDWARRGPMGDGTPAEQDIALLVASFDQLCLWLPMRPLCLFRSLLLLHFLRTYQLGATWVFGVGLFPFHAHCWLAIDGLLIGERVHRAEQFTVILAIDRLGL